MLFCIENYNYFFNFSKYTKLLPIPDNYTLIYRFLGTTPASCSMLLTYKTIIAQLARTYNLKTPNQPQMDSLDMAQTKDLLLTLLQTIQSTRPARKILIILDSLDQLNKPDYSLDWLLKTTPTNTKLIYSTLTSETKRPNEDENKLFNQLLTMTNSNKTLRVEKLTRESALAILENLLNRANRSLNAEQKEIVNSVLNKATLYPLLVQLIYDQIIYWQSYTIPEPEFSTIKTIDDCIRYLFVSFERTFGKTLVSRCFFYITVFGNGGISESELEDILSLDDELLYELFEYHEPPLRRFPLALWNRVKSRIEMYLNRKEVDNTEVIYWNHRRLIEVSREMYVDALTPAKRDQLYLNVIEFYNEAYKERPKRFRYNKIIAAKKKLSDGEAVRYTSAQPIRLVNKKGVECGLNHRKLNKVLDFCQLFELYKDLRYKTMIADVFLNYDFITSLFKAFLNIFLLIEGLDVVVFFVAILNCVSHDSQ